jgi:NADPH-dependent 2,4-dienoyl-CoA reductase/sulfur reductase-like enzyme
MSEDTDLIVIGAGPAGMAAAATASTLGLAVTVLDEQARCGGQIYRNISENTGKNQKLLEVLGADYARGNALAKEFAASGVDYRPATTVWQVGADGAVSISCGGKAESIRGRHVLIATGALERPVPIPGWTLPGVMSAGAAQTLLKGSAMIPSGRVAIAGSGPLLLLVAQQLAAAGAEVAALLETTKPGAYLAASGAIFRALKAPEYLRKGLDMRGKVRAAGIPWHSGIRGLAAEGNGRLERVTFLDAGKRRSIEADVLLLHEGVVPHVQITRQLGCDHEWIDDQRFWRPVLDAWGATSVERISVAGDGGGIGGAEAATVAGRLAALGIANRLGVMSSGERDTRAQSWQAELSRHMAIRPLLDRLFRPNPEILVPRDDATVICRCEEVTAGQLREGVALGATGPNQLKAYMRCGMGPCQGRLCGLPVAEVIAAARGKPVSEIGYYNIRPPIKPITLGELAALDG